MEKEIQSSFLIGTSLEYKRKFSFFEMYQALVYIPKALLVLIANNKSKLLSSKFIERLQLAVTEVNGCPACSYQHTKIALRQGMSNEEISSFLSGGEDFIKPVEAKAIAFVQHFAEARGLPKKYTFDAIVLEYGEEKANIILSAAQLMIAGNIYGIPYSAFQSRLAGKTYKDTSLFYELGMLIGGILLIPFAFMHGALRSLFGQSNIRFDESIDEEEE